MIDPATDAAFMRRALDLAWRGWGRVHPNPLVGAVVVRDGEVVGEGYHTEYGGPHAEVAALAAAGERARGATLYVTLEPCAHQGKTPPCTLAIEAAGIRRVVYGAEDPNPEARGGAERLRSQGVEVTGGVEREAVRAQNAAFFHAIERGDAYVALKLALSLDARLADAPGRSTVVTGPAARAEVHRLRAGYDAILVGIGTALADDPLLTVRGEIEPRVPPVRVVVDTEARLPLGSRLLATLHEAPVRVICAEDAPAERIRELERRGVDILAVRRSVTGGVDLAEALDRLRSTGVRSVFCEGGGRLGSALLSLGRVRRLYLFYAPRLFGAGGVEAFPGRIEPVAFGDWGLTSTAAFGDDALLVLDRRD